MTAVFADTSHYVAMITPRDARHPTAIGIVQSYTGRFVTTEFVLTEVANFFARAGGRAAFVDLVCDLRADPAVEIIPASADLFDRGLELFASRPDKEWSLTDCTSFVVMADRGLADALTADRHFEQAGFRPLLG